MVGGADFFAVMDFRAGFASTSRPLPFFVMLARGFAGAEARCFRAGCGGFDCLRAGAGAGARTLFLAGGDLRGSQTSRRVFL